MNTAMPASAATTKSGAPPAKPVLVLYATREGQTRRIAEHIVAAFRAHGLPADACDVGDLPPRYALGAASAVIVAASVHLGRHEREMIAFVKHHRAELEASHAAFLSVSMSEAVVEDAAALAQKRAEASEQVQKHIADFFTETGWLPERVKAVAGALLYRRYGVLVRFVMRQIAAKTGADTDTSRDHEYTDWGALDQFVDEMVADIAPGRPAAVASVEARR